MRIAALALVGAVTLGLAGCAPVTHSTTSPTPKATAVFASDAAALKAAEKAYAAYLKASDEVASTGGTDPLPLKALVSRGWYANEVRSAGELKTSGLRQVGASAHTALVLQQINALRTKLTAYSCIDLSSVQYIDAQGVDRTPPRNKDVPVSIDFVVDSHRNLLIASNQPWSGQDFC